MKIAICGDVHMCRTSSIIRSKGDRFSSRLENCINSLNWFEKLAKDKNCDEVVYLGDFFNSPNLDDETIKAAATIEWNDLKHYFIVGNHESSVSSLYFNSTSVLERPNFYIIDKPTQLDNLLFLPYILEQNRQNLVNYTKGQENLFIFSHNDIAGISYGPFESKTGFKLDEIKASKCKMFINGHIHNEGKFGNIINLGILTGQNFNEDAFKYDHNVMILDTEAGFELIENPYAFNFYKIEIESEKDFDKLINLKGNAVVSIRCEQSISDKLKEKLASYNLFESRLITFTNSVENIKTEEIQRISIDHLKKFYDFIMSKQDDIGDKNVLKEELAEVCK